MNQTGAVIVTYNSEAEIGPCLDAALPRLGEIVVVDNGSKDGTREEVLKRPKVRYVANATNRGFAAAVNQGIAALETPLVLLLNPDAVLLTGVESLVEACWQAGVAAAGGKLVDDLGRPQVGFCVRRFPTPLTISLEVLGVNRLWRGNPVNRRYRCLDLDLNAPADVEQPAGAFLMIRRDSWEAVGGFDEGFQPLWFEDVDFLKRLQDHKHRVLYVPFAAARHQGAHSAGRLPREEREIYWYASLLRYCSAHFHPFGRRTVCGALLLGSILRMAVGVVSGGTLLPVKIYGKVMRLGFSRLTQFRGPGGREAVLEKR